jgi:pyruvyl transferase EpsI
MKYRGLLSGFIAFLHCIFLLTGKLDRLYFHLMSFCRKLQDTVQFVSSNKSKLSSDKRIFLFENEDDRNLGDLYINISEIEYLKSNFADYSIIEISIAEYLSLHSILPFVIRKRDLICFSGGEGTGFIPTFPYDNRKSIIKKYKKNRKFIYPLTLNYNLSDDGKLRLEKDQTLIKKSNNITICVKDLHSYEVANKYFDCNVILIPDMDLYPIYGKRFAFERKGAMLPLRNDREGILTQQDNPCIGNILKQYTDEVYFNDTQLIYNISNYDRKDVVESFITKIAKSEIVITNLFYGMLLCVITHTPCIILPDFNHDFEEVHDWTSKLEYINKISDLCELDEAVQKILHTKKV